MGWEEDFIHLVAVSHPWGTREAREEGAVVCSRGWKGDLPLWSPPTHHCSCRGLGLPPLSSLLPPIGGTSLTINPQVSHKMDLSFLRFVIDYFSQLLVISNFVLPFTFNLLHFSFF